MQGSDPSVFVYGKGLPCAGALLTCCRSPANGHYLLSSRTHKLAYFTTILRALAIETAKEQFALFPDDQQHAGVEDGRVGTTKDTDQQRQCEGTNAGASEERQRTQREEHRERRIEGAGHRLHEACIHDLLKCLRSAPLHVLADTVKHHDGVMHRETDDRQQSRNE